MLKQSTVDHMRALERVRESEDRDFDRKLEEQVDHYVERSASHAFRDGPGGLGARHRGSFALRAPWLPTIINGKRIYEE